MPPATNSSDGDAIEPYYVAKVTRDQPGMTDGSAAAPAMPPLPCTFESVAPALLTGVLGYVYGTGANQKCPEDTAELNHDPAAEKPQLRPSDLQDANRYPCCSTRRKMSHVVYVLCTRTACQAQRCVACRRCPSLFTVGNTVGSTTVPYVFTHGVISACTELLNMSYVQLHPVVG